MHTSGEGKYKVWLRKDQIGDDLLYILGGGGQPHIGGIVISEPGKKTRTMRFATHYDHIVLKPIAEAACKKYHRKAVAIGGIHIESATKEEINKLVENCRGLIKCI
jgi:hypothetical protein